MEEPLISIIIPVYNIEKYIEICVRSIVKQTYKNFEIILVDDGSTDKSGEICEKISSENNSIKVIHQKNGGLSNARNTGIRSANGKYLMFVDGDDFLLNDKCLKIISENLGTTDILQYKMKYFYTDTNKYIELKDIPNVAEEKDFKRKLYKLICNSSLSISACDKIVSKKFLLENNLFFEEGLISEDVHWSLKIYSNEPTLKIINYSVYGYRQKRENSITNTKNKEKNIESQLKIISYWLNYNYPEESLKEIYFTYLAYLYLVFLLNIDKIDKYKKEVEDYKFLLKYDGNYKVKLAKRVMRILGFKGMILLMKLYNKLKNNGTIKI